MPASHRNCDACSGDSKDVPLALTRARTLLAAYAENASESRSYLAKILNLAEANLNKAEMLGADVATERRLLTQYRLLGSIDSSMRLN